MFTSRRTLPVALTAAALAVGTAGCGGEEEEPVEGEGVEQVVPEGEGAVEGEGEGVVGEEEE